MTKFIHDQVMDNGLNYILNNVDRLAIGTAAGTTYAEGTTYAVGTLATTSGNFTAGDGDTSGRKMTHSAATIAVGTTGTITHIFLYASGGTLVVAGTCAPTAVTSGGTVILSAWDCDEIADVTP